MWNDIDAIIPATTPYQFKCDMAALRDKFGDDVEVCHDKMDSLMCRVLIELGYIEGVNIFNDTDKWYA